MLARPKWLDEEGVRTCSGHPRHLDHELSNYVCPIHGRRLKCEIDEGGLCLACGSEVVQVNTN